jgi:hypothetical protein
VVRSVGKEQLLAYVLTATGQCSRGAYSCDFVAVGDVALALGWLALMARFAQLSCLALKVMPQYATRFCYQFAGQHSADVLWAALMKTLCRLSHHHTQSVRRFTKRHENTSNVATGD